MSQAADFGTGQVFLSMLWFTLFFIWIWLLIAIFADIVRSPDLSGWSKAIWTISVILLPYLGVFVYLIARGHKMHEHAEQAAEAQDAQFRQQVRSASGSGGGGQNSADEIARLTELHEKGVLSDTEYAAAKAKVLS